MTEPTTFAIRYSTAFRGLLTLLGAGPKHSGIAVGDRKVKVRMGWAFRATIPRSSVTGAAPAGRRFVSVGVHGWNGRWLVNGSSKGVVTVDIDPRARAWVLGFPVKLRQLLVAVEDPDGLVLALGG